MEGESWDDDTQGQVGMDVTETTAFLPKGDQQQDEYQPSKAKKIWNRFFGIFVSVTIGVYAGLICRTMQEAWIYAALFCGEALVCACIAGIIKTYSFRKSITAFAVYFLISAVFTPIATWAEFRLGN